MSSEIPRHWRLKAQRYNLVGQKWGDRYVFPPRLVLPPVPDKLEGEIIAETEEANGIETQIEVTFSPTEASTSSK